MEEIEKLGRNVMKERLEEMLKKKEEKKKEKEKTPIQQGTNDK
jgi:hypothetical protein